MKHLLKKFLAAVLLFTLVASPGFAQTNVESATNTASAPLTQAPPAPPSPPVFSNAPVLNESNGAYVHHLIGTLSGGDLVALAAVVLGCAAGIIFIILRLSFRHGNQQELHETIRLMVEKGVPIPPEIFQKAGENGPIGEVSHKLPRNDLRNGLLFMGIGLGCIIVAGRTGFIVFFMGVAFVIASWVEKKDKVDGQPPQS